MKTKIETNLNYNTLRTRNVCLNFMTEKELEHLFFDIKKDLEIRMIKIPHRNFYNEILDCNMIYNQIQRIRIKDVLLNEK
jgi:hypothetical protein